jgi:hypothetical protein
MHAGRIASSLRTRSETRWTGDGGRWVSSQWISQSRANALEPCVAERFMQLDGHGEDGDQAVLYTALREACDSIRVGSSPSWRRLQRLPPARRHPPLARPLSSSF